MTQHQLKLVWLTLFWLAVIALAIHLGADFLAG